jgi:hypothetical protein
MVTWSECAAEFVGDGSLCDVYVLKGGIEGWDALLRLAKTRHARFSLDGMAAPLPDAARAVFTEEGRLGALFLLDWKGIELAAHFFDEGDVELDFVPNIVRGQEALDALCSFLRALAEATGKDVIVTPENLPSSPILRCRPTGEVRYEARQGAA